MRLFKVVANFLSLSISLSPRESELPPVILPANLRRPIPKRLERNVSPLLPIFCFFVSLFLFRLRRKGTRSMFYPSVESFGKIGYRSSTKDNEAIRSLWCGGIRFSESSAYFVPIKERFPS